MSGDQPGQCVWILGLMHSGTTIVWRQLSRDSRFLGFDEPLTVPQRLNQSFQNSRNTLTEYLSLFEADPADFWARFAPIHPLQELDENLTDEQVAYLRYLIAQTPRTVFNETHLHLHLRALVDLVPHGHFIHLHRRARGFVTSHLRSTDSSHTNWPRRVARRLRHENNKRRFWTRHDFLPGLLRHEVIGSHERSKFGLLLKAAGYDARQIMRAPTIVKLLAYWHFHYHYLERHGPRFLGDRFTSVRYEDFASRPDEIMAGLYQRFGLEPPAGMDYSDVYPPKPPFREPDKRWLEAARIAGFSKEELETLL